MKLFFSACVVFFLFTIFALSTAQESKQVNIVTFTINHELYTTWDQTRSNRLQRYILDEIELSLSNSCNSKVNYALFSYGIREFRWVMWYDGFTTDDDFSTCNLGFDAENLVMVTRLNANSTVSWTGFTVQKMTRLPETRPLTCFNDKLDNGEVSTDCGHDACNIPCTQQQYCTIQTDCVKECFANVCQFYSSAPPAMTTMNILGSVALLIFTTIFI